MTLRQRLYDVQGGQCFYCYAHIDLSAVTLDHLVPRACGGGRLRNLVACCLSCNSAKGDRMPTEDEIDRFQHVHSRVVEHERHDVSENWLDANERRFYEAVARWERDELASDVIAERTAA